MRIFKAIKSRRQYFRPFLRRIGDGEAMPRFYGRAWQNFVIFETVCLPIPLNVIASAARRFWFLLMRGFQEPEIRRLRVRLADAEKYHEWIETNLRESHKRELADIKRITAERVGGELFRKLKETATEEI